MGKQRIIKTTVMSQIATKVKWAISLEEVSMSNEISLNDKEKQGGKTGNKPKRTARINVVVHLSGPHEMKLRDERPINR